MSNNDKKKKGIFIINNVGFIPYHLNAVEFHKSSSGFQFKFYFHRARIIASAMAKGFIEYEMMIYIWMRSSWICMFVVKFDYLPSCGLIKITSVIRTGAEN